MENVRSSLTHNKRTPVEVLVRLAREDGADSVLNSFYYSYAHELHDDAVYFALLERFPEKASHMTRLKRYSPALLEALFAAMNPYNRHTILDYQNYDHGYYLRVKDNEYISVPPVEPFSPEMLRRFWQVPDDKYRVATSIRGSVAGYWAVTTEILEEIAEIELADPPAQQIYGWRNFRRFKQSAADTLAEVAGHELTPPAVLTRLMLHVSAKVRLAALDNPNTPREDKIARREPASQSAANSSTLTVRLCALSSPATEHAALRKAAFRGRWMERLAVARNNGAPRQLLAFLSEDSNVAVAAVAREELARRDGAVDSQRNGAT